MAEMEIKLRLLGRDISSNAERGTLLGSASSAVNPRRASLGPAVFQVTFSAVIGVAFEYLRDEGYVKSDAFILSLLKRAMSQ